MDITRGQREERFEKAPLAVQHLYDSEESGECMYAVFQKHGLPEEKYKPYGITIGNVILGFYPLWQLPELLAEAMEISRQQATEIAVDLQPFFAPMHHRPVSQPPAVPVPQQAVPPAQNTWQHVRENMGETNLPEARPFVSPPVPPPDSPRQAPPAQVPPPQTAPATPPAIPPSFPQYQKPLTGVPQYRNADLYKKPPQ